MMDNTQRKVMDLLSNNVKKTQKKSRNKNLVIAVAFTVGTFLAFGSLFMGCTEGDTYISPTIPCCTDTCVDVHTCDSDTGCNDECSEIVKVFEWVCHKGNSKKVYDWQVPKHMSHGDTKGKCPKQPPGDDDDDDGDDDDDDGNKVCICHIPPGNPSNAHTICIGEPAVDAHIRNHGDYLGECVD